MFETHFPFVSTVFHPARILSGSLRSPPSPRGEGFIRCYSFSTYACIRSDVMGKAVFSYRSLPHLGRGTAPAVDRVLSLIVDLRCISSSVFHAARTLSGSLRSLPSPRGEGFVRRYSISTYACIRSDVMGEAVFSHRSLPHAGKALSVVILFPHMRLFALTLWGKRFSRIAAFPIGEGGPR